MNPRLVRLAAAVQVAFFLGWAGVEEHRRASVVTVSLATMPVDPRDVLSGDYLALRYTISRIEGLKGLPVPTPIVQRSIAVRLRPAAPARAGARATWQAVECMMPAPPLTGRLEADGSVWVRGTWLGRGQVLYGIERYYFSERRTKEMAAMRPGTFTVEAGVAPGGTLVLKRLLP